MALSCCHNINGRPVCARRYARGWGYSDEGDSLHYFECLPPANFMLRTNFFPLPVPKTPHPCCLSSMGQCTGTTVELW